MTVNAKLDTCAARVDALSSRFDRFAKRRADAMGRPSHMERSLQKSSKTPEQAKEIADRIKAKTKVARSSGGSEPDLTPIRKDALDPEEWSEKVENLIFEQQHRKIKKKYGAAVADKANYGWGISGDEHYVSVATKVYVGTGKVLLSEADYPSLSPTHDWRDY